MIRLLSFLFLVTLLVATPARADQETIAIPKGDFSALKHTKSGRIDKVIDGLTVLLKDGTIIRLTSLDIPDFHIWRDAPYSENALASLEKTLPEGTDVLIYQTRMAKKGRLTRMKHELAHLVTKKDPIWIQGLLLSQGLARVQLTPNATEMAEQMLTIEEQARQKQIGTWSKDSEFPVLTPETAAEAMGEFTLVEGIVQKTASIRNNVYLNFGDNWKTDFTIMITPAMRKKLARLNIDPLGLAHQKVRVRGWVREYNGPLIELKEPLHLEFPITENEKTPLQGSEESSTLPTQSLTN